MYNAEEGRKLYYLYSNRNKALRERIRVCTDLIELNSLIQEHCANQVHIDKHRWSIFYRR